MKYIRPDESGMFGTASGTVDATYDANWLVDGLAGRPIRRTGNLSLTAVPLAARTVSGVAVINHTIDAARTITIGGDISTTLTPDTLPADGIPRNPWAEITPVAGVDSVTIAVNDNTVPVVIGEFVYGTLRTIDDDLLIEPNPQFEEADVFPWEGEFSSIAPYDPGLDQRRLAGELLVNNATNDEIDAWWRSTRRGTRPTVMIPFHDAAFLNRNDAWLVIFQKRARIAWVNPATDAEPGPVWRVSLEFVELPRVRW